MVLLFNDFPPPSLPVSPRERVFHIISRESFYPCVCLHNSQVRVLEAGHPWRGPHTRAEVRGWCLTHPYYGENPPNGSVNSTTSFAHICSLNPMQSGLLRRGDIIQTPALVTTGTGQGPGESPGPVSCVARVTCARRSHDTGLSVVSWSSGRADVCKVSSTPPSCYHERCHHQRCSWHCHTWPPGLGKQGPMSQAI